MPLRKRVEVRGWTSRVRMAITRRWKLTCLITKLDHLYSSLLFLVYYSVVSLSQAPCLRHLST
jgi:hypothetical protein